MLAFITSDQIYRAFLLTQMKCKSLEGKLAQVEGLTTKVEQLSSSLPPKEKDVLERQVFALKSDLEFKMEQLENDRKRIKDFDSRLETVGNTLTEFEGKLSKVGENNADVIKVILYFSFLHLC